MVQQLLDLSHAAEIAVRKSDETATEVKNNADTIAGLFTTVDTVICPRLNGLDQKANNLGQQIDDVKGSVGAVREDLEALDPNQILGFCFALPRVMLALHHHQQAIGSINVNLPNGGLRDLKFPINLEQLEKEFKHIVSRSKDDKS
jgi:hypothetical protein